MTDRVEGDQVRIKVGITNYRCFGGPPDGPAETCAELGPLTVLVGPNGAGKSSFLDAVRLIGDTAGGIVQVPLASYLDGSGGFAELVHKPDREHLRQMEFAIGFEDLRATYRFAIRHSADAVTIGMDKLLAPNQQGGPLIERRDGRLYVWDDKDQKHVDYGIPADRPGLSYVPPDPERFKIAAQMRSRLREIHTYRIDDEALIEPSRPDDAPDLSRKGERLARHALEIQQRHPSDWKYISDFVALGVPGLTELRAMVGSDGRVNIFGYLASLGPDLPVPARQLSSGTLLLLAYACLCFDPRQPAPPLILVEEPDRGIHASIQELLMQALRAASKRTTVVVTTHSPVLLSQVQGLHEILLVEPGPQGSRFVRPTSNPDLLVWIEENGMGSAFLAGLLGGVP